LSGIKSIAAGIDFACALDSSNGVKCWGGNFNGQLGDGTTTNRATPQYVTGLSSGVAQIFAGGNNACAITVSGGAKCWGSSYYGDTGTGTAYDIVKTPQDVVGLTSGVVSSGVGSSTDEFNASCAVTTSGNVKCWGPYNAELGEPHITTPVDVTSFTGQAIEVAVDGYGSGCILDSSHHVKCWGFERGDGGASGSYMETAVSPVGLANVPIADIIGQRCVLLAAGGVKCWRPDGIPVSNLGNGLLAQWHTPQDVLYVDDAIEIGINKSKPSPYPPVAGQPVSYSIVVTNTTTTNLTNVTVTDVPGPGLGAMTAFTSSPAGTCNTTTQKCTLSSALAPGAVATFNVTFNTPATAGVVITNTAYVTADQWASYVYPTQEPLAAETVVGGATSDLAVTKSASVTSATPGTSFNYIITVTNNSSTAATTVTAVDTLPAGVTFASASAANGGSCSHASGVVTCTWASLAGNASTTATITVTP